VSGKLSKQILTERAMLACLVEECRPLLARASQGQTPSYVDLSALGAILHSFYGGVENIFKRISQEFDAESLAGKSWHRDLLDLMAARTARRPAVISSLLQERLDDYMRFRHRFRHAYAFQLNWNEMSPLVMGCEETLRQVEGELETFLKGLP